MPPNEVLSSASDYYVRMNRQFLVILWAHLGIAILTAYLTDHSMSLAAIVSILILSVPTFFDLKMPGSTFASIANAVALVSFSALLIHVSGGMTELHFHIFASLGLLITLASPIAVIAALLFVVVHHVGFFFFLPMSLINYKASFGILVVHALFALAIGIPAILISQKYRLYIVGVKTIVDEIQGISGKLTDAAGDMLGYSKTLADSTQEEAQALQRTSTALEQLNAMISRNTESADTAARVSVTSKDQSDSGISVVGKVVESLETIALNNGEIIHAFEKSTDGMTQIIALINEIGTKTKVINDIVFQTRLLSFNASVEAARAGEHGKGFAVVAEEIGNLARISGKSATEISQLLEASIGRVNEIVTKSSADLRPLVSGGKEKIESGIGVAGNCRKLLGDINQSLNRVSETAGEIAVASKEQAHGVREITIAMSSVSEASHSNRGISEKAATIAGAIREDSQHLASAIDKLLNAVSDGRRAS